MHQPPTGVHHHVRRRPARRILAAALGATASVTLVLSAPVGAAPAAPVVVPRGVAGDRQSSAVREAAASAMVARDVYAFVPTRATRASYVASLDTAAVTVATEFAVDPTAVRAAWAAADFEHQTATLAALSELGTSYQYASSRPAVGFDCSGLMAYAWSRAGFELTRQSSAQINEAEGLNRETARAGDLVQYPGHVMMYLGFGDAIVHAANQESDVELSSLRSGRSFRWGDPTG